MLFLCFHGWKPPLSTVEIRPAFFGGSVRFIVVGDRAMTRIATWFNRAARRTPTYHPNTPTHWLHLESLEDRAVPSAFTAGDLVVLRVGDGSGSTLSAVGTAVFL